MKDRDPSQMLPVSVAVLMGGESSRFGSPKAELSFQGKSLAAHLLGTASSFSPDVFSVARTMEQVPPDAKSFPFALDGWEQKGPLAGLQAALSRAAHPVLFLCGVDMPFLKREVVEGLLQDWEEEGRPDAVVPLLEGDWEPLCALWAKSALPVLEPGHWRSFQQLLFGGALRVREVPEEELRAWDPDLDCLRNFNTKEEWEAGTYQSTL